MLQHAVLLSGSESAAAVATLKLWVARSMLSNSCSTTAYACLVPVLCQWYILWHPASIPCPGAWLCGCVHGLPCLYTPVWASFLASAAATAVDTAAAVMVGNLVACLSCSLHCFVGAAPAVSHPCSTCCTTGLRRSFCLSVCFSVAWRAVLFFGPQCHCVFVQTCKLC